MNLIAQLQQKLSNVLQDDQQSLVVAYSGGVDSHVLLHAVHSLKMQKRLANPVSAVHIHHGLSPHADDWAIHCQDVCQTLDIPLQVAKLSLSKLPRQSLEAQARDARYARIIQLVSANAMVLLAQHQDDQLETVMLQLKRGAGPKGLAGMAELSQQVRSDDQQLIHFFRPLLSVSQSAILEYAHQQPLIWVEDESNANTDFDRNFLRHQILPGLIEKWPEFASTVSRSAALCAEQQQLLDELSQQKLQKLKADTNSLYLMPLLELSTPWLHQILRYWLQDMQISMPSQAVLQRVRPELLLAKTDAEPLIQLDNWQLRRFDQKVYLIPDTPAVEPQSIPWSGESRVTLPEPLGSLHVSNNAPADNVTEQLPLRVTGRSIQLQFGGFATRYTPTNGRLSKPLRQWYKQWKIPPWQRDKILVLIQDNVVMALLVDGQWLPSCQYQQQMSEVSDSESVYWVYRG